MITKYEKANKGKLLVAVLALFVVLAGAAVVFSDSEVNAAEAYTLENGPVEVRDSNGTLVESIDYLGEALAQNAETMAGQTWTLSAGIYNVTAETSNTSYANYLVSKFVIAADNVTINGAGEGQTIIWAYANSAMQSPELDLNQGDTIAILGDGVTIQNLSVQPMIQYNSTFSFNKAVEVYGNNVTVRNVTIGQFDVDIPESIKSVDGSTDITSMTSDISDDTYGGSIIVNNGYDGANSTAGTGSNAVVIENVTMNNGLISASYTDDATISLSNVTFNIQDNNAATVWNTYYGKTDVSISATSVTANVNETVSDFDTMVSQAVSGMTFNVNATQEAASLTVASGVTLNLAQDVTVTGDVTLAGRLAGTGTLSSTSGDLTVLPGASYNEDNVSFDIITGGTTFNDVILSGTLTSSVNGAVNQRIIVTDDLIVNDNITIDVLGQFIVEDGATVTLKTGAKVIIGNGANAEIAGNVIVEAGESKAATLQIGSGATVDIDGSVTLEGSNSFTSSGTINVNGTFTVGNEATANVDGATVNSNGEIVVYGIVSGSVTNNGTITIDSEGIKGAPTTNPFIDNSFGIQMGAGATVNVDNLYGYFTVSDSNMKYTSGGWSYDVKYDNSVQVMHVSGVVITESLEFRNNDQGQREGINTMSISGTVLGALKFEDATQSSPSGVTVDGQNVAISEDITFTGVNLAVTGGELAVSGNLTVGGTLTNDGATTADIASISVSNADITVTGTITTTKVISGSTVNAARYQLNSQSPYVYTTLANALAAGATAITVTGEIDIETSVEVPVGTTVTANGAILNIAEDATVTVASQDRSSGRLTVDNSGVIKVDGTLVIQNLSRSGTNANNIVSDTSSQSGDAYTYTNIYNALAAAQSGDTVEITKEGTGEGANTVTLDRDVTINDGVTLEVPSTKTLVVELGNTLTVDGTLFINSGVLTVEQASDDTETDAEVIVNGMLTTPGSTAGYTGYIAGAYFAYGGNNVIAPLASAASLINDVESSTINLFGDMEVGDITFDYTGNDVITIVANNNLVAGTIDLGAIAFQAVANSSVSATLTLANGSIILDNVCGITFDDVVSYDADNNASYTATVTGNAVSAFNDPDTEDVDEGSITIVGNVTSLATYSNVVTVNVQSGAVLTTTGGTINNLVIDGTITATGTTTVVNATVMGTMNTDNARINVSNLYVGINAKEILKEETTGANAVVGDGVYVTTVAYVAPGCTVGKEISDVQYITEYYVEDALFVTAYAAGSNVAINDIVANVEHTEFLGWFVEDGTTAIADTVTVGSTNHDKVYAHIDYEIYTIDVSAAPGATVYIDGKEWNANTEYSYGDHEITIYLKAGYQGTPEITVSGAKISGTTFQITGDSTEIMVTGVSAIDYSQTGNANDNGGMGLVEILLVILVVVVVILAIIVVLRMMRS